MDNLFQQYQYKNFNIYKMLNGGYCFVTNNTHDINHTPSYEDITYIKTKLLLPDNVDIVFHFDGVFALIVLKNGERLFSKHFHNPENHGQLKIVSSYFEDIPSFIFGQKPIQLD